MKEKTAAQVDFRLIKDLRELVYGCSERFGDEVLYRYKEHGEEKTLTFNESLENMNRLGTAFAKLGIMGKNVAIIGDAHPAYITTYFATVSGDGVIVPLDKDITEAEIANFGNLSEIVAIVYTSSFNNKMIKLADSMPGVKYFIPIDAEGEDMSFEKVVSFDSLLEMGEEELRAGNRDFLDAELDREKMSVLMFTSGTTGTSKGVMLSQNNIAASVNASCDALRVPTDSVIVDVLPLHHSYDMVCAHFAAMNLGLEICLNDSLKNVMRNFAKYKPTILALVPLFLETMHKRIWSEIEKKGMTSKVKAAMKISDSMLKVGVDLRKKLFSDILSAFGGRLQIIVSGGAPLNPKIIKDFRSFGITVLEGYGITECSPLISVNTVKNSRFRSVGLPVGCCEVKIDRTDEFDDVGEILARGDNVMLGYYRNEEATRDVFTEDGWFRTGDLGYVDSDGYIFITGRKKNVIILSNGKNIFPEELEEKLMLLDSVQECAVVGRDSDGGETVITAVVYPNQDKYASSSHDEIYAAVKEELTTLNRDLPVYKQIRGLEIKDVEFEKTTSKKIKRYKI